MDRIYYIDSENVGDSWLPLIECNEDEILVFYTNKTPYMNYESLIQLKESPKEVNFIKCFEGANALDFQLVSELGFRLGKNSDSEHIIITNDTGFDAVVRYWQKRDYKVQRIPGKACRNYVKELIHGTNEEEIDDIRNQEFLVSDIDLQTETEVETENPQTQISMDDKEVMAVVGEYGKDLNKVLVKNQSGCNKKKPRKNVPLDVDFNKEEVDIIINCIGKNNLGDLHNSLELVYGELGKEIYKVIRMSNYELESKQWNSEERFRKYCGIILEHSDLNKKEHEEYVDFLLNAEDKRKNLNSLRAALQGEFGKDKGLKCYSVFKAHIKVLNHM